MFITINTIDNDASFKIFKDGITIVTMVNGIIKTIELSKQESAALAGQLNLWE